MIIFFCSMRCEENIFIFKVHFGGICVKLIRLLIWGLCHSRKIPYLDHRMDWNFLGGVLSKSKNFKEMYEA